MAQGVNQPRTMRDQVDKRIDAPLTDHDLYRCRLLNHGGDPGVRAPSHCDCVP